MEGISFTASNFGGVWERERIFFLSALIFKTEQNNNAFIHSVNISQFVERVKNTAKYSRRCLDIKLPYHGTLHMLDTPEIFVKLKWAITWTVLHSLREST